MVAATVRVPVSTVALRLGRVSNVPTVWTNVLAGVCVAGGVDSVAVVVAVLVSMSLIYVAGMYLNDFFDREFDRLFRPERPIPAGLVLPRTVLMSSIGMFVVAFALLIMVGAFADPDVGQKPLVAALVLVSAVIAYDVWHKSNPWSPVLMGVCRALVYIVAAVATSATISRDVLLVSAAAASYIAGLTYAAKYENLLAAGSAWPLVLLSVPVLMPIALHPPTPLVLSVVGLFIAWTGYSLSFHLSRRRRNTSRAVAEMIAGISLADAIFIANAQRLDLVLVALFAFLLTRYFQRRIAGT